MNNDPVYQKLQEIRWRRPLTPAEQAELHTWLADHPEAAADQSLETALDEVFARLPPAPVPSNFTARVLLAVEREDRTAARPRDRAWLWRVLIPRVAVAMVVMGSAAWGYQRYHAQQLTIIGNSIATVAGAPLPSPDALVDFDVAQKLDAAPAADRELIALLQ